MVHAVSITEDLPLLRLLRGDVLLIDDEDQGVELYRVMDQSYAAIAPTLVEQGAASSTLSAADLALVVAGHPELAVDGPSLALRSGRDRRVRRLRLEA
jgi:hypothetical protein